MRFNHIIRMNFSFKRMNDYRMIIDYKTERLKCAVL